MEVCSNKRHSIRKVCAGIQFVKSVAKRRDLSVENQRIYFVVIVNLGIERSSTLYLGFSFKTKYIKESGLMANKFELRTVTLFYQ